MCPFSISFRKGVEKRQPTNIAHGLLGIRAGPFTSPRLCILAQCRGGLLRQTHVDATARRSARRRPRNQQTDVNPNRFHRGFFKFR